MDRLVLVRLNQLKHLVHSLESLFLSLIVTRPSMVTLWAEFLLVCAKLVLGAALTNLTDLKKEC